MDHLGISVLVVRTYCEKLMKTIGLCKCQDI
jgi:hypothetical protein